MITGEIKSKVDKIWDTMWSGGVSNPLSVIEQLTYLLFIKRLDEVHTLKEAKAARTGKPIEDPIFAPGEDHLRWTRFKDAAPEKMFETVRDEVFPFIKGLGSKGDGEERSTYAHHMKDATFMMPSPRVLANVVDQLDAIDMSDRDTKGDLYEYMLGKIASAGQNGQFRTPRHIIKLMVDMTAPTPKDVICDPACGTAGFLVAASEYLVEHHSDAIYKDAAARRRFNAGTFHGYDFDNTMLRIGSMNMLLHGVENPDIRYKDSLAQADDDDDAERYSLVLANPPFSGSLDYESTSKDLLRTVKTRKTELLFLALFRKILRQGGRAAVVVPAGVLESDSKAHSEARRMLVEEMNLEAVIKLPHWVFKPYASVDTSILLLSKGAITNGVWFYRVENDGYADDAQKSEIEGTELNQVVDLWRNPEKRIRTSNKRKHRTVSIEEIRANNYDLCPPYYLSGHRYPENARLMRLGELFDISKGPSAAASALDEGKYPFVTSSLRPRRSNTWSFDGAAICIPTVSATGHGHAAIRTIHLIEGRFDASSITAVLTPKSPSLPIAVVYYYLLAHKDELIVPLMRGATNKSLSIDRLADLEIPILNESSTEAKVVAALLGTVKEIAAARQEVFKLEVAHDAMVERLRLIGQDHPETS
ncbi:MAG: N-6 DNA methylase [Spirochaetaceae bacterium]|nr:N-6 DNA methylase [Myxococcales bacterium]MCB9726601.1 N-6 DNA methylase [Spirochaetaceae bacterium]